MKLFFALVSLASGIGTALAIFSGAPNPVVWAGFGAVIVSGLISLKD